MHQFVAEERPALEGPKAAADAGTAIGRGRGEIGSGGGTAYTRGGGARQGRQLARTKCSGRIRPVLVGERVKEHKLGVSRRKACALLQHTHEPLGLEHLHEEWPVCLVT